MHPDARAYREGLSLSPESRRAIENALKNPTGIGCRTVTCTPAEARDMLDYFRSGADALATLGDANAVVYARAFDNTRRALQVAALST